MADLDTGRDAKTDRQLIADDQAGDKDGEDDKEKAKVEDKDNIKVAVEDGEDGEKANGSKVQESGDDGNDQKLGGEDDF